MPGNTEIAYVNLTQSNCRNPKIIVQPKNGAILCQKFNKNNTFLFSPRKMERPSFWTFHCGFSQYMTLYSYLKVYCSKTLVNGYNVPYQKKQKQNISNLHHIHGTLQKWPFEFSILIFFLDPLVYFTASAFY